MKTFLNTTVIIVIFCSGIFSAAAQLTTTNSYAGPSIPLGFEQWDSTCNGPNTTISITLPAGELIRVDSISTTYDIYTYAPNAPNAQQSQLFCENTGIVESVYGNLIEEPGEDGNYQRTGIPIANGTYFGGTTLTFQIRAWRLSGGDNVCSSLEHEIGSWDITVHHSAALITPKIGINNVAPVNTFDVGGKIRIGHDNTMDAPGSIQFLPDIKDFQGFDGQNWYSLTSESNNEFPFVSKTNPSTLPAYTMTANNTNISPLDTCGLIYDSGGPFGPYGGFESKEISFSNFNGYLGIRLTILSMDIDPESSLSINGQPYFGVSTDPITIYLTDESFKFFSFFGGDQGYEIQYEVLYGQSDNSLLDYQPITYWRMNTEKAAMYGGFVDIQNTKVDSLGFYSLNYGFNNKAKGDYSFVLGKDNSATALHSMALGNNNFANDEDAIVIGHQSNASGYQGLAFGNEVNATGNFATAIGHLSLASGQSSISIGQNTSATESYTTALGYDADATGFSSTAVGYSVNASGFGSTVLGNSAIGSGAYALSLGTSTEASGLRSTAIGSQTKATGNYSTAMGSQTEASGDYSTALGRETEAIGDYATTFGSNSTASGNYALSNGFYSHASGGSSTALGSNNSAEGDGSFTAGILNKSSGYVSISLGYTAFATGDYSFAAGRSVTAGGDYSIALGGYVTATGDYSIAMGQDLNTNNFNGCLLLGDASTNYQLLSSTNNQFMTRYFGGYRFYTSPVVGVQLNPGNNAWTSYSDFNKKENFEELDGPEVLNKIAEFRSTSWNYKGQDPKIFRHYGIMAQDFYGAFGQDSYGKIGCDTLVNPIDLLGIAYVAIQTLDEKRRAMENENSVLKAANSILELRLEAIEKKMDQLFAEKESN